MIGFELPLPEPRDDAEWVEWQDRMRPMIAHLMKTLPLYAAQTGPGQPQLHRGLALLMESLERIRASRGARPELAMLLQRYRELVPPAT